MKYSSRLQFLIHVSTLKGEYRDLNKTISTILNKLS